MENANLSLKVWIKNQAVLILAQKVNSKLIWLRYGSGNAIAAK